MRYWIEYLINNTTAYEDFITWSKEAEDTLKRALSKAIRDEEMEKGRGIAHELAVYETLRKRVHSEVLERTSQAQYNEQQEGRQ